MNAKHKREGDRFKFTTHLSIFKGGFKMKRHILITGLVFLLCSVAIVAITQQTDVWFLKNSQNDTLMQVNEDGNVGIGTTDPAEKLDVDGTVQMTGFKMSSGAESGKVLTSNEDGIGTWEVLPSFSDIVETLSYDQLENYIPKFNETGKLILSEIYQDDDDNIGIGDETPSNKLSVNGNADFTGNVGIGTTSPSYDLHVKGTPHSELGVEANSSMEARLYLKSGSESTMLYQNSSNFGIYDGDKSVTRLRIDGNGNVGIGINPSTMLEVNGSISGRVKSLYATNENLTISPDVSDALVLDCVVGGGHTFVITGLSNGSPGQILYIVAHPAGATGGENVTIKNGASLHCTGNADITFGIHWGLAVACCLGGSTWIIGSK